jgi:hypothetical protein
MVVPNAPTAPKIKVVGDRRLIGPHLVANNPGNTLTARVETRRARSKVRTTLRAVATLLSSCPLRIT